MSQKFSRTESRLLGALSKLELDNLLVSLQVRIQSRAVPGTSWNTNVENQEPNGDRSQNDPYPEVGSFFYHSYHSVNSDPKEVLTLEKKLRFFYMFHETIVTSIGTVPLYSVMTLICVGYGWRCFNSRNRCDFVLNSSGIEITLL